MTDNTQMVVSTDSLEVVDSIREKITKKHKKVSNIKTPKPFIKKKMGMEYVEYSYMREIADKEFPGWSWEVVSTKVLGSEAYVVHGRLKFYDEGIWRKCDVPAAHRIQKQRGTNDFVDIGNDVKAANTDAIKKAFNMYMNIADDVYRNQVDDLELSDLEKSDILVLASEISEEKLEQIKKLIEDDTINTANYKASFAKLEREIKEQKENK
jgi:CO dehydrogenase/acetyl-CoA synthase epsilon subunit